MVRPPRQQPDNDNVIPLSPFRAELGRARRLRRADALLAERDVEAAVRALPGDDCEQEQVAVIIRLVDALYRYDTDLARRLLAAASSELDTELGETASRWQRGRMEDLGFADYSEALEVYRELDLGSVRIG